MGRVCFEEAWREQKRVKEMKLIQNNIKPKLIENKKNKKKEKIMEKRRVKDSRRGSYEINVSGFI